MFVHDAERVVLLKSRTVMAPHWQKLSLDTTTLPKSGAAVERVAEFVEKHRWWRLVGVYGQFRIAAPLLIPHTEAACQRQSGTLREDELWKNAEYSVCSVERCDFDDDLTHAAMSLALCGLSRWRDRTWDHSILIGSYRCILQNVSELLELRWSCDYAFALRSTRKYIWKSAMWLRRLENDCGIWLLRLLLDCHRFGQKVGSWKLWRHVETPWQRRGFCTLKFFTRSKWLN